MSPLQNYEVRPIPWSRQKDVLEELAACPPASALATSIAACAM